MTTRSWPLLLLCLCLWPSQAQAFPGVGNRGENFWLALPGVYNAGPVTLNGVPVTLTWSLLITSDFNATGVVQIPGVGFTAGFSVPAGSATRVDLPLSAMDTLSDAVTQLGVEVTANQSVAVYGCDYQNRASESFLGLSQGALGTQYMVLNFPTENLLQGSNPNSNVSSTEFTVVGSQAGTSVTIIPSVTVGSHLATQPYEVTLNQGDVYQLTDNNIGDDLTGTLITSSQPIGVWGVNSCADVPVSHFFCNPLIEELWPIPYWGTSFVTVPYASRLNGDTFRFLAFANSTSVTVNGVLAATLNQGQVAQTVLTAPSYITSNNPIYVGQYSNSYSFDYPTPSPTPAGGDPSMSSVPAVGLFDNDYVFQAAVSSFPQNYVNLLVPASAVGAVTLDGNPLSAASFSPIGASGYWGAAITLSSASHHLSASQAFGAQFYGFWTADAYGNPGGILVATYSPTPTPTPCGYPGNTCTPSLTPTPTATFSPTATLTPTLPLLIWPDPFSPQRAVGNSLKIQGLPSGASISFYTLSGELVIRIQSTGSLLEWKGINQQGAPVATGIYYYAVQSGSNVVSRGKILIMNNP